LDTGTWGYLALYGGTFLLDTGTWGYLALYGGTFPLDTGTWGYNGQPPVHIR